MYEKLDRSDGRVLGFRLTHRDDVDRDAVVPDNRLLERLAAVEDRLTEIREIDTDEIVLASSY